MHKDVVAFDVDNTLFNWVDCIVPAIREMVVEASRITGLTNDEIAESLRVQHQKRHSVEHPYSLADTDLMKSYFEGLDFKARKSALKTAFEAFDFTRNQNLKPYPGVHDVLESIGKKFNLVVYTESSVIGSSYRLQALGLEKYFSHVYCGDVAASEEERARFHKALSHVNQEQYVLIDPSVRKPSPSVLMSIQNKVGAGIKYFIGDSLFKDIGMAREAGITSVWAKYGTVHDSSNAAFLVKVSHWSQSEIAEFKAQSSAQPPEPDYILDHSIRELIPILCA